MKKFESVVARIVNYIGNDKWTASLSSNALWYYIEFRYNGEPSMIGGYSFRPKCDKEIMSKEFLDTWFVSEDETPLPEVPKHECEKLKRLKSSTYSELEMKLTLFGV